MDTCQEGNARLGTDKGQKLDPSTVEWTRKSHMEKAFNLARTEKVCNSAGLRTND